MDIEGEDVSRPPDSGRLHPTLLLPAPPTILAADPARRTNSPLRVAGVLGAVLGLVMVVAVLGGTFDGRTAVSGTPFAAPGQPPAGSPKGAAPGGSDPAAPHSVYELATNPLLANGIGLAPVTCQLPVMTRDTERLRAFYQAAIGCLDQAWRPVLAGVNEPFTSPQLEIQAGPSQCGAAPPAGEATAYYCSGGRVIFMPVDRLRDQAGLSQATHLAVLAHEYGHHVQALSGILNAAYEQGEKAGKSSPEKLELTRRAELQANCFSGMFIASIAGHGSVSSKLARAAADSFRDTVADDTHGSVKHQLAWGRAGFDNNRTSACNTWTAPASEVS